MALGGTEEDTESLSGIQHEAAAMSMRGILIAASCSFAIHASLRQGTVTFGSKVNLMTPYIMLFSAGRAVVMLTCWLVVAEDERVDLLHRKIDCSVSIARVFSRL